MGNVLGTIGVEFTEHFRATKEMNGMRCPHCNCRDIGKIGANQYYCWGCFMEFNVAGEEIKVFEVAEDGSLVAVENLANEVSIESEAV
jgi:hypothetical protein